MKRETLAWVKRGAKREEQTMRGDMYADVLDSDTRLRSKVKELGAALRELAELGEDSMRVGRMLLHSAAVVKTARAALAPRTTVAALFVQTGGAYFGLDGVDPWDEARDARQYAGPHPVVAHPPCQLWVNFAALNFKRYGGEHNRPGNDGGCFASALAAVRRFGGVLEHPAGSKAFAAHGLPRPVGVGWTRVVRPFMKGTHSGSVAVAKSEWVCEVWQSAYGHKARKRTWLFAAIETPPELDWSRPSGTHQVGWFDRIKPTLSKKESSATPPAFREALLQLAESCV